MSPTAVFATLLIALVIDYMSIGADSIRDRVAFCLALPAVREGWDGSQLDLWTVQTIATFVDTAKRSGNGELAAANTALLVGVLIGILFIYCIGCLLPTKASAKLGKFAQLAFSGGPARPGGGPAMGGASKYRLNYRLWACAILLGMTAEMPNGLVGEASLGFVDGLTGIVAPVPSIVFGVS